MNRQTSQVLGRGLIWLIVSIILLAAGSAAVWARESPPDASAFGPQAAPEAPDIAIARVVGTNNVELSWMQVAESPFYEVWRGTAPYFNPASGQGNQIIDIDGAPYGSGQVPYVDDGVDRFSGGPGDPLLSTVQVIGDVATNYFWVVRGRQGVDVSENSNRVGEFDFALVPGS